MLTREILQSRYFKKCVPGNSVRDSIKSDDPKTFVEGYVNLVAENAALIAKFPFLLPLDYHGKVPKDYDFTYTEVDMVPNGWHNLIVNMSSEIIEYLRKQNFDSYLFHIDQLKEKFGSIRLYYSLHYADHSDDEGIDAIIQKYEELSEHTCCICGSEATLMSKGWICPYCEDCADKLKANEGKHWDFVPLERSTWKKIEVGEVFGKVNDE